MTKEQKVLLRQKIYFALDQDDPNTAKKYMDQLCMNDPTNRKRSWSEDEIEFLMHHVKALGYETGIAVVAKRLNRTKLAVKNKYSAVKKKIKSQQAV